MGRGGISRRIWMKGVFSRGWLPAAVLVLAGLVLLAGPAGAVERKTMVGKVSGTPMGTWMTVTTGSTGPGSTMQVDLAHAKITEKGKPLKRYSVTDGMK